MFDSVRAAVDGYPTQTTTTTCVSDRQGRRSIYVKRGFVQRQIQQLIGEQFARVAYVDRRFFLITGEDPDLPIGTLWVRFGTALSKGYLDARF